MARELKLGEIKTDSLKLKHKDGLLLVIGQTAVREGMVFDELIKVTALKSKIQAAGKKVLFEEEEWNLMCKLWKAYRHQIVDDDYIEFGKTLLGLEEQVLHPVAAGKKKG